MSGVESIFEAGNLKSNGHYALAVIHQNTVYVSGQFAIDPITQEKKFGTIEEETLQALSNIEYILKKAGSHKDNLISSRYQFVRPCRQCLSGFFSRLSPSTVSCFDERAALRFSG